MLTVSIIIHSIRGEVNGVVSSGGGVKGKLKAQESVKH